MKRLPLLFSLLAVIALSSSVAYWFLQLYKVENRPIVAAPTAAVPEPAADAAAGLFGGQAVAAVASNYQLTGVVAAGRESVAILVADGQPPKALKVGKEIMSGVTVTEVHPRYVMLSEGGVLKRIDLATDAKAGPDLAPPMAMPEGSVQGQAVQNAMNQRQNMQQQNQQYQQSQQYQQNQQNQHNQHNQQDQQNQQNQQPVNQQGQPLQPTMEAPPSAVPPGVPAPPPQQPQMPAPTRNVSPGGQPPTQ